MAGYVLTEFSDIEWEFNGVLDYLRDPKSFADEFATVNGEVLVVVEPERHVVAPGEQSPSTSTSSTTRPTRWTASSPDGRGWEGGRSVSIDGFGTTTYESELTVAPSPDTETGPHSIEVTLDTGTAWSRTPNRSSSSLRSTRAGRPCTRPGRSRTRSTATVSPSPTTWPTPTSPSSPTWTRPSRRSSSAETAQSSFRNPTAGWPQRPLRLPEPAGRRKLEPRRLTALPGQRPRLGPLSGRQGRLGVRGSVPHDLVVDLDAAADDVHVGSVEGWIANLGSPLLTREHGDGTLCCCTFRVTDAYGEHPTATTLVDRLLRTL